MQYYKNEQTRIVFCLKLWPFFHRVPVGFFVAGIMSTTAAKRGGTVTGGGKKQEWSDRLYPYANREPLYHYASNRPGRYLTDAEHDLNRGALKARWDFVDKVLPGGAENKYITHPEVAVQNWWERCVVEKPGFITSLVSGMWLKFVSKLELKNFDT